MTHLKKKPGYLRLQSLGENTESDLFQRRRLHFDDGHDAINGMEGVYPLNR